MENSGWIYLRVHKDEGYCFGKTDNPDRRDSEYRKENPFIRKVYDFFVTDMIVVESELINRTKSLRLFPNSKEWIRFCDEAKEIVDEIRKEYALMTYQEWQQLSNEQSDIERLEAERLRYLQQEREKEEEAIRLREAAHQAKLRKEEEERQAAIVRREQQERQAAIARREQEQKERVAYMSRMTKKRICPTCQIVGKYDANIAYYRCPKCKSRCV